MNLEKEVDFCMPLQNTEDDIIFMFLNLFSYAFTTKIVIEEIRHLQNFPGKYSHCYIAKWTKESFFVKDEEGILTAFFYCKASV